MITRTSVVLFSFTKQVISFRNGDGTKSNVQENQPNAEWRPQFNPWLIAVVVALAAFMEVLDTSIANVALPHISGNLGASMDQGTWVLTTYLVSNAIVLPITGWITSAMGRKRFFLICIALFTVSSVLCGIAPSLPVLLFARILQGAGGGGMQPMSQAIMADSFPPRLRPLAFALYGVTVVVAPALGPTLGGWITDNFTWRWIFFINIPIGLLAFALVYLLVQDPPFLRRFKPGQMRFDTIGFSLLVLGVGALQILLDKGQEDDWFGSNFISMLVFIAVVCLGSLAFWEWRHKQPVVDVHLFRVFNFSSASIMMFMAGAVAFSSTILMPQFLQIMVGYSAQDAGMIVSVGAGAVLVTLPIVAILTGRFAAKYIIAVGWFISALGLYVSTRLFSMDIGFNTAALVMLMQFVPVGVIFVPAVSISYVGVPQNRSDSVAGLTNFFRNIGSSVGASIVTTVLARRQQFHISRLADHLSVGCPGISIGLPAAFQRARGAGLGAFGTQAAVIARVYRAFMMQATTLAYIDTYILLCLGSTTMFFLCFFLKANDPRNTEQHLGH
jgi:DHA2 family multidrug resistance protein